jgi:Bax protein
MEMDFKKYHEYLPKLIAVLAVLFVIFIGYQWFGDDETPAEEVGVLGKTNEFIEKVAAAARERNAEILETRKWLVDQMRNDEPSDTDKERILALAEKYKLKPDDHELPVMVWHLLQRVDVVPVSLVVAQAANESAWGKSRFAREGNNLFGIWCYTEGCGIVPKLRKDEAKHEVRRYDSFKDSVIDYMKNINRHRAYQKLREIRAAERAAGRELSGHRLAAGLAKYSEIGDEYIKRIRAIIDGRKLALLDTVE